VGQHHRIAVADRTGVDALGHDADHVGRRDLPALAQGRCEALLGLGELEELVVVAVLGRPPHRRADAHLELADRIGLVDDRGLLGATEVELRLTQDLEEELLFGVEVPVEDALADPEALHDLGDRGRVIALVGEATGGVVHELALALLAARCQAPVHRAGNVEKLDRVVK